MVESDVSIIIVGPALEGLALRGFLEASGRQVDVRFCGSPEHFMTLLRNEAGGSARTVIVSAHGSENGIYFGEFGPEVPAHMLRDGHLPSAAMSGLNPLNSKTVILTGCCLGSADYVELFMRLDVQLFMGPKGYAESSDVLMFLLRFLHASLTLGMANTEAARVAGEDAMLPQGLFEVVHK